MSDEKLREQLRALYDAEEHTPMFEWVGQAKRLLRITADHLAAPSPVTAGGTLVEEERRVREDLDLFIEADERSARQPADGVDEENDRADARDRAAILRGCAAIIDRLSARAPVAVKDNPKWRCKNGHVSQRYLMSEEGGAVCPACYQPVWLTHLGPDSVRAPEAAKEERE